MCIPEASCFKNDSQRSNSHDRKTLSDKTSYRHMFCPVNSGCENCHDRTSSSSHKNKGFQDLQSLRFGLVDDREAVLYRQKPIVLAKRSATLATIPFVDNALLRSSSDTELSLSHHFKSAVASSENWGSI